MDVHDVVASVVRITGPVSRDARRQPNIAVIGTGGTIAGTGTPGSPEYDPGRNGIGEILAQIPDLGSLAKVSAEQMRDPRAVTPENPKGYVNLTSAFIQERQWLLLARQIEEALNPTDPTKTKADAIVVTHGTDTLEETALFLQLVLRTDKPIILVGAGRPTFLDDHGKKVLNPYNDGLRNIRDAIRVASDPRAKSREVMVVMNGKIHGAFDVWKCSGMLSKGKTVDMFDSPTWWGRLGTVLKRTVHWRQQYDDLRGRYRRFKVDVSGLDALPRVPVFSQEVGEDNRKFVEAELAKGVRAFVFEGPGQGSLTRETRDAIDAWSKKYDAVFVRAARVPHETVPLDAPRHPGAFGAGPLSPVHAKIFLQLAMATIARDPTTPGASFRAKVHGLMERFLIFQQEP